MCTDHSILTYKKCSFHSYTDASELVSSSQTQVCVRIALGENCSLGKVLHVYLSRGQLYFNSNIRTAEVVYSSTTVSKYLSDLSGFLEKYFNITLGLA